MLMTAERLTTLAPSASPPPKRAAGVELLGRYEGSGFKEPPYLVRRGDGQMIQLPPLLYLIVEQSTGARNYEQIADAVGEAMRRGLAPDDVQFLVDEKLRPLGLLNAEHGDEVVSVTKPNPMLALKFKTALVPAGVVRVLAAIFSPLFFPPVILAVLVATVGLDYWLFFEHGVAQSLRAAFFEPGTLLLVFGLVVLSAAFHECGHAAATRYGGAQPGAMGAGLYLVWPAFYTDLTDAYTLGRGGRLRADLGGVYFNTIFMLMTAGAYLVTGFEPLLLLIPLQHLEIVHQLLPFLRLDGYYIVSDLTGVPDILSRIKPTLKSLVPGLETDPRVQGLKPWARGVVTLYVLLLVPVMIALFSIMAFAAPRVFATAWDAFGVTWQRAHLAIDRREEITSLVSLIQLVLLGLTPVGLALTLAGAARRISGGLWGWTEMRPRARVLLVAATSATVTALFLNWWTNGAYRPIAVGERGTLSARAFDIRDAVGRESHERSIPRRPQSSEPASQSSRVDPANVPARPETRRDRASGSAAGPDRVTVNPVNPWMAGAGGTSASQNPVAVDPSSSQDWTAPVGTTAEPTTTTPTATAPSTTTPQTTTTTATTTTP
jgi:putative peptide zinc metalloprotease protein